MKKVLLTLLFVFAFVAQCFAYTPDPARWEWLGSDDKIGLFIEKRMPAISNDYNNNKIISAWICTVKPEKGLYSMEKYNVKYPERTIALTAYVDYNINTERVVESYNFPSLRYDPIVPGSIGDEIYTAIVKRAGYRP